MTLAKPAGWTNRKLLQLTLPAADTLQGFLVQDDGSILASQGVPHADVEDTYISKHVNNVRVGTMVCPAAGHGTILGGLEQDRIVFDFNGKLIAAPWFAGTLTRSTPGVEVFGDPFQVGNVWAVIDRPHERALFYDATTKIGKLRSLADVASGADRVLGQCTFSNRDAAGKVRLRQGWGLWDLQAFGLIGDPDGGQELHAYNLTSGVMQWRLPAKFTSREWEEPEGLFVLPAIEGNPAFLCGMTNRVPTGASFTREHLIYQLRDPNAKLPTDLGWMHVVDPLDGFTPEGCIKTQRAPGYRLWVERTEVRFGRNNAVTTFGTYYDMAHLAPGQAAQVPHP